MKACMVTYSHYESDTRVQAYTQSLQRQGYDVDVVALGGEHPRKTVAQGIRIFHVQNRSRNETTRTTYLTRLLGFFFRSMFVVTREHLKHRYDVIHIHSIPDFEVFATLVPKLTGAKIILDIHDLVPELYSGKFNASPQSVTFKLLVAIERISAKFSDHVIAANDLWLTRLRARASIDGKCTALLTLPSTQTFYSRPRTRRDDKFVILYPGTLSYHQGVDLAVRAFALIHAEARHAEFHIYGGGDQRTTLESLVDDLNLADRVFFHPMLPTNEISAVMANADLGIVPKRNNSFGNEAFSSKILEFMCLGVPLIIPNTDIDRFYFDETLVKFFQANDEKSLAQAMLSMITTPELRRLLARNSAEFVQKYTWEANESSYLNLVKSLVEPLNGKDYDLRLV